MRSPQPGMMVLLALALLGSLLIVYVPGSCAEEDICNGRYDNPQTH